MRTSTKVLLGVAAGLLGSVVFGLSANGASAMQKPHITNKNAKMKRNAMKAERVHAAAAEAQAAAEITES